MSTFTTTLPHAAQPTPSASPAEVKPPITDLVGHEDLMYYFDLSTKLRRLHRTNTAQPTLHHYIKDIGYSALELLRFETTSTGGQLAHPDLNPATQLLPHVMFVPPFATMHKSDITQQQLNTVLTFKPSTKPLHVCKWVPQQVAADAAAKPKVADEPPVHSHQPTTGRLKKRKPQVHDDDMIVDIG